MTAAAFYGVSRLGPSLREHMIADVGNQYGCDVELNDLQVSAASFTATGKGLVLKERDRSGLPPLATVESFTARISPFWLLLFKVRLSTVTLAGLKVNLPPRRLKNEPAPEATTGVSNAAPIASTPTGQPGKIKGIVFENILADGAEINVIPRDERKGPMSFAVRKLRIHSIDATGLMNFDAVLINPVPTGTVDSSGAFGPWDPDDPSLTPVSGNYTFKSDLAYFRGISGKLTSAGKYHGVLGNINVDGDTNTPDFAVETSGQPVHLKTHFHAIVDGTNGDTYLQPVNAQFGGSAVVVRGGIYGVPGVKGKKIALDVATANGKIADMLRLAIKGQPLMTGAVAFKARLEIPPGEQDLVDKLYLNGSFNIADGSFTKINVQKKINELSNRAQGDPKAGSSSPNAVSDLSGNFELKNGVVSFSKLGFTVPGANVSMTGAYTLADSQIAFKGAVSTQAKISQMTTGVKSFFLKIADPLFKRNGAGAVIPIHVNGTDDDPKFGVDVGRVLKRK